MTVPFRLVVVVVTKEAAVVVICGSGAEVSNVPSGPNVVPTEFVA